MSFTATERLLPLPWLPPSGSPGPVRTLVWQGDSLVDWVGRLIYQLDGSHTQRPGYAYRYKFDATITSPSGEFVVIYERFGTKALLLRNGELLRELNRSYYCAGSYEYPIAFVRLSTGQELLAHCPEKYCQLELEDAATGQCLTRGKTREPDDYFFSRLGASPSGQYLVSGGWIWHPWDVVKLFDVAEALRDPSHLDGGGIKLSLEGETGPACFGQNDSIIIKDSFDNHATPPVEQSHLRSFDIRSHSLQTDTLPAGPLGEMMAVGNDHVINFHTHPRLINLHTGVIEHEWSHLSTGTSTSSISDNSTRSILALDPQNLRFAVVGETAIHVLELKQS